MDGVEAGVVVFEDFDEVGVVSAGAELRNEGKEEGNLQADFVVV